MTQAAAVTQDASVHDEGIQYLTFSALDKPMAIAILDVKEIIEVADMTRVPMTSDNVRGVINLRGNVVPVVDLSARLGGGPSTLTARSCIVLVDIIVDGQTLAMGMLVDAVNEILEISHDAIQKTPEFGTDIAPEFIDRMGRVGSDFIILLNLDRVLDVADLSVA
ncbi:MAG: chemotaxis protein CheW [Halieaceae bacterium]|jgi:purine-binding chemotaxis protein CheW|nr:chemotaxis protein CheW [Halieaceae bacterium]